MLCNSRERNPNTTNVDNPDDLLSEASPLMAWIESHQSLGNHPKTKKLCKLLGLSVPTAIGHLQMMWWWALDYAQDGDVTRFDDLDLAIAAGWDGDERRFVDAMVAVAFLDRDESTLVIHDWYEYAGKLIERRKRNAKRMADARADDEPQNEVDSGTRAEHVQRTERAQPDTFDARVELPLTNQPLTNQPTGLTAPLPPNGGPRVRSPTEQKKSNKSDVETSEFARFYEAYPRHQGRVVAWGAWKKIDPDPYLFGLIMAGLEALLPEYRARPPDKIPLPSTWLNGRHWTDEPLKAPHQISTIARRGFSTDELIAMARTGDANEPTRDDQAARDPLFRLG